MPSLPRALPSAAMPHDEAAPLTPYAARHAAEPPRGGGNGGNPVARYLDLFKRHRWLLLIAAVVGLAVGLGSARLVKPEYTAEATLWINKTSAMDAARGPIIAAELLQDRAWIELLRSYAIADSVVNSLGLFVVPASNAHDQLFAGVHRAGELRAGTYTLRVAGAGSTYELLDEGGTRIETGALGDSIGRAIGLAWRPSAAALRGVQELDFQVRGSREASVALAKQLTSSMPERSNFLRLTFRDRDPQRGAQALNTWTQQFVASAMTLKKQNLVKLRHTLEEQLRTSERDLMRAETDLERFRTNTITLPNEGGPVAAGIEATRDPVLNSYFDQKERYDELRHDRELLERLVDDVRSGRSGSDVLTTLSPTIIQSAPSLTGAVAELNTLRAQLRDLQRRFTDEHSQVKQQAAAIRLLETRTIPALAEQLLGQMRTRESELGRRIDNASRELRQIPARTIEEMRLRRQVVVSTNLYNTLKERYEEAKLAEASAVPDVTILDTAVAPRYPNRNPTPMFAGGGMFAFLALGVGIVILRGLFDRRLRYVDQATQELGLSVLGVVPMVRRSRRGEVAPETLSQLVEAIRAIRLNVRYAAGPTPVAIAVSSPGAHDGKSFVSSNLALTFAESGLRTLLVDADIRRGDLHNTFGTDRCPGLTDLLAGQVQLEDTLRKTGHEGLFLLPSGQRQRLGPERLMSDQLPELLRDLRRRFDVVIVDTPPFSAGIDAFALGVAAGHLLVVLRTGESDRKSADVHLRIVDRLPVNVLGAVLNAVPSSGEFKDYAYDYGYHVEGDADAGERPRILSTALNAKS
jgi:capsular exopolysaccharide synthesis family protein